MHLFLMLLLLYLQYWAFLFYTASCCSNYSRNNIRRIQKQISTCSFNVYISSSPHCTISIDMEATQYLTAAGRLSKYIRLPWYRGWQNSTVFISQNTILADPQLIWELPFPKTCTEQMWGSASEGSHYNSANFQTVQHAWICVCLIFFFL